MLTTNQVSKKLGKNLAKMRTKKNVTQEELALKAGLNRAYIGYIERGERNPSIYTMYKLTVALKVNMSDLFSIK